MRLGRPGRNMFTRPPVLCWCPGVRNPPQRDYASTTNDCHVGSYAGMELGASGAASPTVSFSRIFGAVKYDAARLIRSWCCCERRWACQTCSDQRAQTGPTYKQARGQHSDGPSCCPSGWPSLVSRSRFGDSDHPFADRLGLCIGVGASLVDFPTAASASRSNLPTPTLELHFRIGLRSRSCPVVVRTRKVFARLSIQNLQRRIIRCWASRAWRLEPPFSDMSREVNLYGERPICLIGTWSWLLLLAKSLSSRCDNSSGLQRGSRRRRNTRLGHDRDETGRLEEHFRSVRVTRGV